eukprot:CAMPEP_0167795578 /NCGR_PEP_ID=MMETSP0111_2-20121227/14525_1 /TAXON_ID=91324 /ORGANISM="Lotharella globosa, Strain CCCM811" /LENGTH=81 /DNA_ID=CAMNT_0007689285 /DNA_START=929 /DNA_END=1174 /DNA_ORIENTATION=-
MCNCAALPAECTHTLSSTLPTPCGGAEEALPVGCNPDEELVRLLRLRVWSDLARIRPQAAAAAAAAVAAPLVAPLPLRMEQ